jgi:hypothetical protein
LRFKKAFHAVHHKAVRLKFPLRTAAWALALKRVAEATHLSHPPEGPMTSHPLDAVRG